MGFDINKIKIPDKLYNPNEKNSINIDKSKHQDYIDSLVYGIAYLKEKSEKK
jgi:hypothetical protein